MIKLIFQQHKTTAQLSKCCIHISSPIMSKNVFMKQGKIINKIMATSTVKRKRTFWESSSGETMVNMKTLKHSNTGSGKGALRRIAVLNKLFMKHITDLVTTGEVADKIAGHSIEISEVAVTPDFQRVNIFWLSKVDTDEAEKEKLLEEVATILHHELHRLSVMGSIPQLVFVADKKQASLQSLDVQLAKADYGEDFVPTDPSFQFKSEFFLNTRIEPEIIEKIKSLESTTEIEESPLPPMRHDVFGLDQDALMKRIAASIGKSNDAWSKSHLVYEMKKNPDSTGVEFDNGVDISPKEQRLIFTKFLKKRQILRKKAMKQENADPYQRVLVEDNSPEYEKYLSGVEGFDDEEFENYFNDENIKI